MYVPFYLKFMPKVTYPFEQADFDRFALVMPQPTDLTKKLKYH